MMLDDGDYNESVENIIETQKVNAEYAVAVTGDNFAQMFRAGAFGIEWLPEGKGDHG